MTIPGLYALLERLAANADEQKRYRDAKEIREGMKALAGLAPVVANGVSFFHRGKELHEAAATLGYAARLTQRKIGRDAGLKTLPAYTLRLGSGSYAERCDCPPEDLTVLLPGEEP